MGEGSEHRYRYFPIGRVFLVTGFEESVRVYIQEFGVVHELVARQSNHFEERAAEVFRPDQLGYVGAFIARGAHGENVPVLPSFRKCLLAPSVPAVDGAHHVPVTNGLEHGVGVTECVQYVDGARGGVSPVLVIELCVVLARPEL